MNLGIVVLEYAWAIREELCWLAVHRPDQLKQPQIITLQFADLNQNDDFYFGQAVYKYMNYTWN